MTMILLNSFSFLLAVALAYLLKTLHLLKQSDGQVLAKIVMYITLPATIVVGVNGSKLTSLFLVLMALGILCNVFLVFTASLLGRKKPVTERALQMFFTGGYNIGNFTIPFVAGFFPLAIPYLAMFDTGNSFMVSGTTQAIVETVNRQTRNGFDFRAIVRILLRSPTFVVYIIMFLASLFHFVLPNPVLIPFHFLASANSFLSLFMIGLFWEIKLQKEKMALVRHILLNRYAFATFFAVLIYFFLPFSRLIREVLVLIMFCPISNLTTIQATQFGCDEGAASLSSSLSIIISLVMMSGLVIIL